MLRCSLLSFFFFLSFSLFLSRFLLFILLSNFFLENRIFVVIENQTIEKVMELLQMLNEHAVRTRITRTRCSLPAIDHAIVIELI